MTEKRIREFIERSRVPPVRCGAGSIPSSPGDWRNPGELKGTFASASLVGALTVFNVGGNKYRIAAFVHYRKQIVFIKEIGTHEEYDKWEL